MKKNNQSTQVWSRPQKINGPAPLDVPQADGRPFYAHVCMAVIQGDSTKVQNLLEPLSSDVLEALLESNGWADNMTLLLMACAGNHLDIVRYLVGKGAYVNDNGWVGGGAEPPDDVPGVYPVHLAASVPCADGKRGSLPMMKYLLEEAKAYPWVLTSRKSSIFHYACIAGNLDLVRYLYEESPLGKSIPIEGIESKMRDDPDLSEEQKKQAMRGFVLIFGDAVGGTGLAWAVSCGHAAVVKYLVEQGGGAAYQTTPVMEGKTLLEIGREKLREDPNNDDKKQIVRLLEKAEELVQTMKNENAANSAIEKKEEGRRS